MDNDKKIINFSKDAITYDCAGEKIKVDFNNDVEPKTADLFFVAKNTKLTLPSVETGSGAKYSDGDVEFWTHQETATLAMTGADKSLNCVKQITAKDDEIIDENGNVVTTECKVWFDGCNTCHVGESGMPMACTRKMCAPGSLKEARCLDDEQK